MEPPMFHGRLKDGRRESGIGIYIPQKDLKLSIRTSSHSSISSKELATIESCLLHVKDSYQGEILNLVIFTDSLSSLMNLEESNNAYNDPDVYRILSIFQSFKKKAKKSHWSGYLPILEFLEMSKRTPWQKLLQPRIQLSAGFRQQSRT